MSINLSNSIFENGFVKSLGEVCKVDFPMAISWELSKLALKIDEKAKIFSEKKNSLINKYGTERNGTGKNMMATDDSWKDFAKEFDELLTIEEEYLDKKVVIKTGDLTDVKVRPMDLSVLDPILDMR